MLKLHTQLRLALAVSIGFLAPAPVLAGDPPPFPEFTFKMGKPPKPGTTKRITVQIDPEEQARTLARPATGTDEPEGTLTTPGRYG